MSSRTVIGFRSRVVRVCSRAASSADTKGLPDFSDTERVFKTKSNSELKRAALVFGLCQYDWFVDRSEKLMKVVQHLLSRSLFNKLMKATFYGQFVAGENTEELRPLLAKYKKLGVRAILAYSVEDDTGASGSVKSTAEVEKACDNNFDYSLQCINTAADTSEDNDAFAAIKLTGLGSTTLLKHASEELLKSRQMFSILANKPNLLDGLVTLESICNGLKKLQVDIQESAVDRMLNELAREKPGGLNIFEWMTQFNQTTSLYDLLQHTQCAGIPSLIPLNQEEWEQNESMMKRLEGLCQCAENRAVTLLIDAEQSYYQPAITHIAVNLLMPQFNRQKPVVYNTQQCYLKDSLEMVKFDMASAAHHNCCFGIKIVRGAYIDAERKYAIEQGIRDVVWATKAETDASYAAMLDHVIRHVKDGNARVLVASHNEDSVHFGIKKMAQYEVSASDGCVVFGQQLGMSDHVTLSLANAGYAVYKYMPYGPVEEVLPYLSRRAIENRSMMVGADRERKLMAAEISRRKQRI